MPLAAGARDAIGHRQVADGYVGEARRRFRQICQRRWEKNAPDPAGQVEHLGLLGDQRRGGEAQGRDLVDDIVKSNPTSGDDARIANYYNAYHRHRTRSRSAGSRRSRPTSTGSRRLPTRARLPRRSATRCAPTPTRSTIPISTPRICSASSSPRRSTTRPRRCRTCCRAASGFPTAIIISSVGPGDGQAPRRLYALCRQDPDPRRLPNAQARAQKIVALEKKIAQAHETLEASQESTTANNPWKRADFDKKAPGVDWGRLLGAAQLGNQQDFIVWQPGAVTKLAALVAVAAARRVEGLARVPPHQPDDGRAAQGVRRRAFRLLRHRD